MGIFALGDETNDFVNNKIVDQLVKRWEDHGLKKELGASGIEKLYFNLPRQIKKMPGGTDEIYCIKLNYPILKSKINSL